MAGHGVNGAAAPEVQAADPQTGPDLVAALRSCMLAYEQYDARWRRRYALNGNEKLVLLLIADGDTTTPSELSRAIGMTSAGMTNLLDRLEQEGYVNRERHASDRRRVLLTLTKRGLTASVAFGEVYDRILADVTDCNAELIHDFLRGAARALGGATGVGPPSED